MIELVDRKLTAWINSILENAEILLGAPRDTEGSKGVGLYLMDICKAPPTRTERPPLQIMLRYLITVRADTPETEHEALGRLIFAALENQEIEVESEPLPAQVWAAFGVAPRPSITIKVPCRREREWKVAPPVRFPIDAAYERLGSVTGQVVVGPGALPMAGVPVELPELHLATRTNAAGYFSFVGVPVGPRERKLAIRVSGKRISHSISVMNHDPLLIRLQEQEGVLTWRPPT